MICIKHKAEFDEKCPDCTRPPPVPLKISLHTLYNKKEPYQILYVSDIEGNLNSIHRFFTEEVELNNLACTITLTFTSGCSKLMGVYDYIFLDADIQDTSIYDIKIKPETVVQYVDPSKQIIL